MFSGGGGGGGGHIYSPGSLVVPHVAFPKIGVPLFFYP